jgi:hypothetical protein
MPVPIGPDDCCPDPRRRFLHYFEVWQTISSTENDQQLEGHGLLHSDNLGQSNSGPRSLPEKAWLVKIHRPRGTISPRATAIASPRDAHEMQTWVELVEHFLESG